MHHRERYLCSSSSSAEDRASYGTIAVFGTHAIQIAVIAVVCLSTLIVPYRVRRHDGFDYENRTKNRARPHWIP